jgi:hypothetical protein
MDIRMKTEVMISSEHSAQVLRAIMFHVFEDFLLDVSAEDFALRYGSTGTLYLSEWSIK